MLHRLFEDKAQQVTNQLALVFNEIQYSYTELNTQINRMARCLQSEYHISHGQHVVVFLPKSSAHLILFMAIIKLGAIYIPLSTADCPIDRLEKVVNATNPALIIVDQKNTATIDNALTLQILLENSNKYNDMKLEVSVSEEDIAYVIYTSGTTGAPKGVPIRHAGLVYWWHTMSEIFSQESPVATKNVLSFCLPSFDASIWEYMMAWITGSALYIIDDKTRNDINNLTRFIGENAITHATLTPSILRQILLAGLPATLSVVHTTGEACTQDIIEVFEREKKQLFNCYGPTEATFGLSVQLCSSALYDQKNGAPIGYPIGEEIKIHILNENHEPANIGELYIDSPYLTPGYFNLPDETRQRFITINDRRLYKTGDNFYNDKSNQVLRYLGRINLESIKIRGAMINVIEIENILKSMASIQEACITVHNQNGQKVLVAHIRQAYDAAPMDIREIRRALLKCLPSTALPAKFVLHKDALPLTHNGKIDRNLLKADTDNIRNDEKLAGNFLSIEKKIQAYFKQILEIDIIKKEDTFFSLGGDSITLYRLIINIEKDFSVTLSTNDLYEMELNVFNLIRLIHLRRWQKTSAPISLISDANEEKKIPMFLIHPITGEASSTYLQFAQIFKNEEQNKELQLYGITARGLLDPLDITDDIELMAKDYVCAIKKMQPTGPYLLLGWSFGGVLAWKIAELLEIENEKISSLVMLDTAAPFVLQNSSSHYIEKMLLKLLDNLKGSFSIEYDLSHLKTLSSSDVYIKDVFIYLIQENPDASQRLQLIAALLLANQSYQPQALSSIEPRLFSCKETRDEVYASLGRNSPSQCHDLCWYNSIPLQSGLVTRQVKPIYNHFDFMLNQELIREISIKWKSSSLTQNLDLKGQRKDSSTLTPQEILHQLSLLLLPLSSENTHSSINAKAALFSSNAESPKNPTVLSETAHKY